MGELLLARRQSWRWGHVVFGGLALFAAGMLVDKEPVLCAVLVPAGLWSLWQIAAAMFTMFHFHEHGLRRLRFGRELATLYRDVACMNVEIVRRYRSDHHVQTDYELRLAGVRALFRVSPDEKELPPVLNRIAGVIADRLEAAGDVKWGQTAKLTARGVESLCTPRLLQKPQPVHVAYDEVTAIGFEVGVVTAPGPGPGTLKERIGYRQMQLRGATADAVVRLHCSEDNFYPGYLVLLRRLSERVRSLPSSDSSLAP
jgi:hypothetical protein